MGGFFQIIAGASGNFLEKFFFRYPATQHYSQISFKLSLTVHVFVTLW
jgi:hypothetical protein